jgi:hypothetical protein
MDFVGGCALEEINPVGAGMALRVRTQAVALPSSIK